MLYVTRRQERNEIAQYKRHSSSQDTWASFSLLYNNLRQMIPVRWIFESNNAHITHIDHSNIVIIAIIIIYTIYTIYIVY